MNKQRKVLITITYNEMGIIIDTKTEELGLSAQPEKRTEESTETHACDSISRQAAIGAVKKHYRAYDNDLLELITFDIERLPSAQPEIIRCKDCKYRMPYDWMFSETWQSQNMDDYPDDEIGCLYCDMAMKADDYCSRAERIKGEAE